MKITEIALKNRLSVFVMMFIVIVAGYGSHLRCQRLFFIGPARSMGGRTDGHLQDIFPLSQALVRSHPMGLK